MFEELVSRVLIRYLGDYIEDLDKKQLQFSILGGNMELQNLCLKTSALNKLNLPILVKAGFIGKLTLIVPWSNLKNQSIIMRFSRVMLIAYPNRDQREETAEEEKERRYREKLAKLAEAEKHLEMKTHGAKEEGIWARLVEKVVDNIQIQIDNVHMRYEDSVTDPDRPFSIGVTLESIEAFSTGEDWVKAFIDKEHSLIYKILRLKNLAVYLNNTSFSGGSIRPELRFANYADMEAKLSDMVWRDDEPTPQNQYILHPVSGEMKLRLNKAVVPDAAVPKHTVDLILDQIALNLDETQYHNFLKLMAFFSHERRLVRVKKSKQPEETHGVDAETQRAYVNLYVKMKRGKMSKNERLKFETMEQYLSYDDIWASRLIGQAQLAKEKEKADEEAAARSFVGSYASSTLSYVSSFMWTPKEKKDDTEGLDLEKLRDDFLKTIEYDDSVDYTVAQYADDYVKTVFRFAMQHGSLTLLSHGEAVAELSFDGLSFAYRNRPGSESSTVNVALEKLLVHDHITPNTAFGVLLTPSTSAQAQKFAATHGAFFKLSLEMNPLTLVDTSVLVSLDLMPSDLVVNRPLIDRIVKIFSAPKRKNRAQARFIRELSNQAKTQMQGLADDAIAKVDKALKQRSKRMRFNINAFAPNIVIPENVVDENSHLLVASLGFLSVQSLDLDASNHSLIESLALSLKALQVTIVDPTENVSALIEKFDINLNVAINQGAEDQHVVVKGTLPALNVKVSSSQVQRLLSIVNVITGPQHPIPPPSAPSLTSSHSLMDSQEFPPSVGGTPIDLFGSHPSAPPLSTVPSLAPELIIAKRGPRITAQFTAGNVWFTAISDPYQLPLVRVELSRLLCIVSDNHDKLEVNAGLKSFIIHDLTGLLPSLATSAESTGSDKREFVRVAFTLDKVGATGSQLALVMNALRLSSHRGTMMRLIQWIGACSPAPSTSLAVPLFQSKDADLIETFSVSKKPSIRVEGAPSTAPFRVLVNITAVQLLLFDENTSKHFAELSLASAALQYVQRGAAMCIEGSVGSFDVVDLCDGALYRNVIGIEGDHVVKFYYTNSEDEGQMLSVRMTSVRAVFVSSLIQACMNHVQNLTPTQTLIDVSSESAEKLKDQITDPSQSLQLDILVNSPQLIFPRNAVSLDCIVADLGQITIRNAVPHEDAPFEYMCSLTAMNLRSMREKDQIEAQIVMKIDVLVSIQLPDAATRGEQPAVNITATISSIDVVLSEFQYALLLDAIFNVVAGFAAQPAAINAVEAEHSPPNSPRLLSETQEVRRAPASTPPRPRENTSAVFLQVMVVLQTISLRICHDDPVLNPIAFARVLDLQLVCQIREDSSTHLEFVLHSIHVDDERTHVNSFHRHLLAPRERRSRAQPYRQLRLLLLFANDKTALRLVFNRTRAVVIPEAVSDIVNFFVNFGTAAPPPPSTLTLADSTPVVQSAPVEETSLPFELSISVTDPEVWLIRDVAVEDAKALVAKARFLIRVVSDVNKSTTLAQVKNFEIFSCNVGCEKQTIAPIVHRWDLYVRHVSDKKRVRTTVHSLPLQMVVSYQDFVLVHDVANALTAVSGGRQNDGQVPSVQEEQLPLTATAREREINVRTSGAELLIIDDSRGTHVPLLACHLEKAEARLSGSTLRPLSAVAADIALSVRSYNSVAAHWDSLVSEWSSTLVITFYSDGTTKAVIRSDDVLELTVTKVFVDTLLGTLRHWKADYTERDPSSVLTARPLFDPYVIKNLTGAPLIYSLSGDKKKTKLVAGASQPLIMPGASLAAQLRVAGDRERSTLSVDIPPYGENLTKLPLDKVGVYALHPQPKNEHFTILYSVGYADGSRVLSFHSDVELRSEVDKPLTVHLRSSTSMRHTKFTLAADSAAFVPLEWLLEPETSEICIVADPNEEPGAFLHLSAVIAAANSAPVSPEPYVCDEESVAEAALSMPANFAYPALVCSSFVLLPGTARPHITCVRIVTPIIVENLLPCPAEFRITDLDSGQTIEESLIAKGGQMKVAVPDVVHRVVLLRLRLDGFGWSAPLKINVPSSHTHEVEFRLRDGRGRVLNVYLAYDLAGARTVQVYVHYWLINRTGLRLLYKHEGYSADRHVREQTRPYEVNPAHLASGTDDSILGHFYDTALDPREWYEHDRAMQASLSKPLLFSPDEKDLLGTFLSVKVANSRWSHPFLVDTICPQCHCRARIVRYHLILKRLLMGTRKRFSRTKVVTVAPRYVLVNAMECEVSYKQQDAPCLFTLRPREKIPFHWIANHQRRLRITLGDDCQWSGGLKIDEAGKHALNIRNNMNEIVYLARVEVLVSKGTSFVIFSNEDPELPPYRIENCSSRTIAIYQKDVRAKLQRLRPFEAQPYAWEEPAKPRLLVVEITGEQPVTREISLDKIKAHRQPIVLPDGTELRTEVVVDGPTRVFRLMGAELAQLPSSPSKAPNEVEITEQNDATRRHSAASSRRISLTFDLAGIGISVVDQVPKELFYLVIRRIHFDYASSVEDETATLTVGHVQLDNQLRGAVFPIVLAPVASATTDLLHLAFVKSNYYHDIHFFEFININAQGVEVDVSLDELFINECFAFFSSFVSDDDEKDDVGEWSIEKIPVPQSSMQQKKIYCETFMLGPLKINLGLKMREGSLSDRGMTAVLGALLKAGIASLDNVPIILNALAIKHPFCTSDDLLDLIQRHYSAQVIQQFYKMVGYIDILGSPITLLSTFGTGVYDFFYEPLHALVVNPKDLLRSLGKGSASLVGKSFYGVFNSVSKITGTVGKVIATVSGDRSYVRERQRRPEPRHLGDALALGAHAIGYSLVDGLYGVIHEPYVAVRSQGPKGLPAGALYAARGVVTLPALGLIDLLTTVSIGARNTATLLSSPPRVLRSRPPRCFRDLSVPAYDYRSALGQFYLWSLSGYERHTYQWHIEVGAFIYLLTNSALFCIQRADQRLVWTTFYEEIDITSLERQETSVRLPLHSTTAAVVQAGLFGTSTEVVRELHLGDTAAVTAFVEQLKNVISNEFLQTAEHE